MFGNFLSRPNVRQPILTQYCDGQRVSCPNWMSQWGSKYLGDQNYSAIEIIRYYYGSDMYINEAEEISGIPVSWPRENLDIGSSGSKVRQSTADAGAAKPHRTSIYIHSKDYRRWFLWASHTTGSEAVSIRIWIATDWSCGLRYLV